MIWKTTKPISLPGILLLALVIVLPCSAGTAASTAVLNTLYTFTGLGDGGFPEANVVKASTGALYGTTSIGGSGGWGTVYALIPNTGGKTYTEKTLYSFKGGADGANPVSDLVIGTNTILYGTTYGGGANGYGTVFQVAPGTGGTWTQKVLYSFQGGTDGAYPAAGVVWQSSTGILYGTTYGGGTAGLGTVFEVIPSGGGVWTEKVIYSFQGGTDGANPISDLTLASSSPLTLYGTTQQGGSVTIPAGTSPAGTNPGCAANPDNTPCVYENWGTVFQLTASGTTFTETLLYTFFGASDGGSPESALIVGPNTVLYGSTFWGGTPTACVTGGNPQGCGVVYQLTPPSSGSGPWTETALHTFTGKTPDGAHPYRNLALNSSTGTLFGTTYAGGQAVDTCFPDGAYTGCGIIFDLVPPTTSGGSWTKGNLIALGGNNGGAPNGVIFSSGGDLFGTTELGGPGLGYGIVFEWVP